MQRRALLPITVLALLLGACASMNTNATSTPNADGHIAGITLAANEGEIQQGNAAASRATSAEVRSFAQMMVTDHTNALNAARDTAAREGITPDENETTRALRANTPVTIQNLNTWSGVEFDRRYMQSQIDLHQWLLTALDSQLIPMSRDPQLRALLETQRTSVAAHLEHARAIRGRL
jgi:putative membrane protein